MSIDAFFHRTYNKQSYNCAHFVSEVWLHLTGEDIALRLSGFLLPVLERRASFSIRRFFKRLERPKSPCVALFLRTGQAPHVGIYLDRKIFHIREGGSVEFQPLNVAAFGFERIHFYETRNIGVKSS